MTIPIYPDIVMQQDLSPDHFGAEIDDLCQQIRDATKGWYVAAATDFDFFSFENALT